MLCFINNFELVYMKKNKLLKKFLIFFIITFFLGLTIFIIIITRGGKITPEGIVETGVIRVIIEPSDIDCKVYIDDSEVTLTKQTISNLEDGNHLLRVESDGYTNWQKNISVVHGLVTETFARLYPTDMAITQVTNSNINNLFFSPDNNYIYYAIINSEFGNDKGIWRLKLTKNNSLFGNNSIEKPEKVLELSEIIIPLLNNDSYEIKSSADNKKILITTTDITYLFDIENNESPRNITKELSLNPTSINWFDESNSILIYDKNILFEYNLDSKSSTLIHYIKDQNIIFTANNHTVYYFNTLNHKIYKYINNTPSLISPVGTTLPEDITAIYSPTDNTNVLILKTNSDYKYLNIKKGIIKSITTLDYQLLTIAPQGNSILFKKNNHIYAFSIKEILATNTLQSDFTKILTKFDDLDVLKYTPNSTHILYYSHKAQIVAIIESDGNNVYQLNTNGFDINKVSFTMNITGENIFLLLSKETQNLQRSNIFRIDLETDTK